MISSRKLIKNSNNRHRLILRQRLQIAIRRKFYIYSGIFIVLATIGWSFYFQFGIVDKAYAGITYYSMSDGSWGSAIWSKTSHAGPTCSCNPGGNFNQTANVIHNVVVSGYSPFRMSGGGTINVSGGGKLTINSNMSLSGGSTINIAAGDTLIVNGNLNVSASNINVSGHIEVSGNVNLMGGSSTVCGPGTGTLFGTLTGSLWCFGVYLPISLLSFNAESKANTILLSWATATELNNDFFTIERSKDGTEFKNILVIAGAGNSTTELPYSVIDDAPMNGISYYRLKQTDYDGKFVYFPAVAVEHGNAKVDQSMNIKTVGPNPFTDHFNVSYSVNQQSSVEIQISKISGQLVHKETITADEGDNIYSYNEMNALPPGIYLVNMKSNGEVVSKKLIKQ